MNKLETLKCVEVTSQTQANNGTICYHDPITGCDYMSYENGYIRRAYKTVGWRSGQPTRVLYQLNPKRKAEHVSPYSGKTYECVERVMITDTQERLDRLARAVANYRKTWKKEVIRIEEYKAAQKAKEAETNSDLGSQWKLENDVFMTNFQDSIYQYFQGNLTFEMAIREIRETLTEIDFR